MEGSHGVLTILEAILGKVIGEEIEAWLPQAGPRLLRYAVSKLPADERERYAEEWAADLDAIPGQVSKVIYALGFVKAAWGMRRIANRILSQQHEVIRAMYRNKGRLVAVVSCDESLTASRHERVGQLLITAVPNLDIAFLVAQMLPSCVMKVYTEQAVAEHGLSWRANRRPV